MSVARAQHPVILASDAPLPCCFLCGTSIAFWAADASIDIAIEVKHGLTVTGDQLCFWCRENFNRKLGAPSAYLHGNA
jgi:hypothetical protein